jgi:cytoskeleton protein RodZ
MVADSKPAAAAPVPVMPPVAEPKAELPKAEPPKAESPKMEAPKVVEPPKADPPRTPPTIQRVAATESGGSLRFQFRGRSWVEIRDAGGKVLLTGMNDPGSQTEVVGKPPFRVVVGNAPEVRMFFNDREFDLAPHMREAVARVTVE